jgi:aspartokinase/homoserine dehydrogenase 1
MAAFNTSSWDVHKFGGTSVGSADCMRKCIEIIRPLTRVQRVAVVVSAIGGKPKVTDLLLDSVHSAASGDMKDSASKLQQIHDKHKLCVADILRGAPVRAEEILSKIDSDLKDIGDLLKAVQLMRTPHEQILELVSGYGEVWSATIMTEAMRQEGLPFVFLNARDVLVVSEDNLGTKVHWEASEEKLAEWIRHRDAEFSLSDFGKKFQGSDMPLPHILITGYIASTPDGIATTLKRDGSDFSASIFGKMLKSVSITIWTDVSGVYSADPRRVPEAQIIPDVSYTEAIELAYFGAKVIHPKTMAPAILASIPIFIRNTFEPQHEGTRIYLPPVKGQIIREKCVCGFSTVDNIALLNIEGTGMIGVPGIAHRLFGALKTANISVMFIAQASSEHSICFATKDSNSEAAKQAIEEAFFYELKQGLVSAIRVINSCSIIAAVGESMSNMPGVSGVFFGALGAASINILSISQGCDERNISAVVYAKEATRALRAVHSAFWLSSVEISIGVLGTGRVGSAVLQSLLEQVELLLARFGLKVNIRGVANSRHMMLGEDLTGSLKGKLHTFARPAPLKLRRTHSNESQTDLRSAMDSYGDANDENAADMDKFLDHVLSGGTPHTILIDTTTSSDVASKHPAWLRRGAHIVTANKRAISSSLDLYNAVWSAARGQNRMYMSEVTIGAALPIRTTLNDLLCSGDAVQSIVGLMSVSAGVVLTDVCEGGLSFTQSVQRTHAQGLFEDDPFLDLEGTEAAQKLLILARDLGVPMQIEDIDIEPLAKRREVGSWTDADLGGVFAAEDKAMAARAAEALANGCTLRYVQRIECSPPAELGNPEGMRAKASIRLEQVKLDSPHAMVKGAIYHFSFHTARYAQNPLVVQVCWPFCLLAFRLL